MKKGKIITLAVSLMLECPECGATNVEILDSYPDEADFECKTCKEYYTIKFYI